MTSAPLPFDGRAADAPRRIARRVQELAAGLSVPDEGAGLSRLGQAALVEHEHEHDHDRVEASWLATEGYVRLPGLDDPHVRDALIATIGRLSDAGYPAVFVYLTDEVWRLGEVARERISRMLGHDYSLVPDVWAWRIPQGAKGWPPHRGWDKALLDRGAPELVNVWIALTDAAADQSCIHCVPLEQDGGYPGDLARLDAPLSTVRAMPVSAGTGLAWNANLLHWGGPCSERAAGPRVSCSFTLVREAAGVSTVDLATLDVAARIDLVAAQIATYGEGQPDVGASVLEWARATNLLRTTVGLTQRHTER